MAKSPKTTPASTDAVSTEPSMDRSPREAAERESEQRTASWQRPSTLPTPNPIEGISFRYIRVSTLGSSDSTNVSSKFREGWRPVLAKDHPEIHIIPDYGSRFEENIEIGGMLLCSMPTENVKAREEYQAKMTKSQIDAVDNSYLRESDSRMPVLAPERSTSFGD